MCTRHTKEYSANDKKLLAIVEETTILSMELQKADACLRPRIRQGELMTVEISSRSIRFSILLVLLLLPWPLHPCQGGEESQKVIDVGSKKQLFIDEMFIGSSRGVRLTMNPPYQIGDLLIKADQPWETKGGGWIDGSNSVIKQDGRIRMWYDLIVGEDRCMCYAESEDGIHFTKPRFIT